jgi:putative spermidine/putrescine transport system ATP-binding protein
MSEGRIEQIGTPSDIYNFPATPFVASFVGTLNLLQAKVVDPAGGGLEIEGQRVRTDRAVQAPSGSIVSVALRPESITLGDGTAGANRLKGPLQDVSFLGSIVRMRVGLGRDSTSLSLDRFNDPHLSLPPVGQEVTVTFLPEACLVLADTPAGSRVAGAPTAA